MKKITTIFALIAFSILMFGINTNALAADGHTDPSYLQVMSAEEPLVIDGALDETDWQRRFDFLVYNAGYITGDVEYAVTGDVLVHGDYPDTTTTLVKFLHYGLDLYVSLTSDDHSVGKFGTSWEGDGLFMKIHDANGTPVEYKLYFNLTGTDPDIHYEEPGLYPGSGEGTAWKHPATIVNDTTAADSGYTAEMVIHLDQLGYTDPYAEVPVMINIFDPDGYLDTMDPYGAIGSYHKMWWGSEWGSEFRILRLADPPLKVSYKTEDDIVLDGKLDELFWANAEYVVVGKGSALSTGGYYMQWGDTLNEYTDQSMATVKFIHKGTDLYIGIESDDASVCKWSPGWEADGLFLWMTEKGTIPAPGERMEIKAMYFTGTEGDGISFETNANVPSGAAEGVSFEPTGTVTHTETNGPDAGYSIEVVVHTEDFGYSVGDTVMLSICMWDLDSSSADAYTEHVSDYAPNWWGTQWVATDFERYYLYRGVVLKDEPVEIPTNAHTDPPYIQVVSVEEPLIIDGVLDETDWLRRFDYLVYNVGYITGDIEYAVTGDVLVTGTYTDTTTTLVKFLHDGLDLYISLTSDDHYVGVNGTSWEGDGLFMKIKDASGTAYEYKLFFNHTGTDPDIHYEEGIVGSGEGAAWKHPATIVNDDAAPDSGYTAEMVIHLDQLGYTDPYSEIPVMINIFDPDENGTSYHKMWWGSEWGSEFRILRLADPPLRTAYKTEDDIVLDGKLDESLWNGAEFAVVGKGSALSTGGYYMQWGDVLNEYTDQSMATVKFIHKGTDLYIGIESDDVSVCKWSPGWEADGMFLWMTEKGTIPAPGERMEIKAMYFSGVEGEGIVFETNANVPSGAAEGASFEPTGTVTHTETNGPDAGYSIEVVIHTADFGYAVGDTVMLSVCMWDLDYASADAYNEHISDYAPNWWGTQWVATDFERYYLYRGVVLSNETVDIDTENGKVARAFTLHQNYPNPFNPSTTINFEIPGSELVTLEIYNVLGQKVATLINDNLESGYHSVEWNGLTDHSESLPTGVYFCKLTFGESSKTSKMVLLK